MKHLVPLAVLALIVAGFAYYTLFSVPSVEVVPASEPTRATEAHTASPVTEVRTSFAGTGSLYSLLQRGDSIECAVTYIPNPLEPELSGNIFTSGGDFRGDFVVPTPDLSAEMVTSLIIADNTIWQWTDINGELVGSKQVAQFDTATLERLVSPIGFTSEVQYNCLTWSQVDYTIFEAPNQVLFTDAAAADFEEGTIYPDGEF